MFERISLAGLKSSNKFGYAATVAFFKRRKHVDFKPGLNILFGPNGCGKSTLLQMLAGTMCAIPGGISAVSEATVRENVDMLAGVGLRRRAGGMKHGIGLAVVHDGQPVVYCDPRQRIGLTGGGFDPEAFEPGLTGRLSGARRSHGEAVFARTSPALALLTGTAKFPEQVAQLMDRKSYNSTYCSAMDVVEAAMMPTIARGQPSVLLDEPDANFSLVWQARLWAVLAEQANAERYQLIVASHSPYALGIKHANYIDFVPGEREEAEAGLRARFGA